MDGHSRFKHKLVGWIIGSQVPSPTTAVCTISRWQWRQFNLKVNVRACQYISTAHVYIYAQGDWDHAHILIAHPGKCTLVSLPCNLNVQTTYCVFFPHGNTTETRIRFCSVCVWGVVCVFVFFLTQLTTHVIYLMVWKAIYLASFSQKKNTKRPILVSFYYLKKGIMDQTWLWQIVQ